MWNFHKQFAWLGSTSLGSSWTFAAGGGWVFLEKLGKAHSNQLRVGFFWSRSFYFFYLERDITFNSSDLDSSQADGVTNTQQRSSVLFGGAHLCLRRRQFKVSVLSNLWVWFRRNNVFSFHFKHGHCFFFSQKLEGKIMVRTERTSCFPCAWSLVINSPREEWGVSLSEQPRWSCLSVGWGWYEQCPCPIPKLGYLLCSCTVQREGLFVCSYLHAACWSLLWNMALDKNKYREFSFLNVLLVG